MKTTSAIRSHCLYRAFNAAGQLLYAGATLDLGKRLNGHSYVSQWWDQAATITIERFTTSEELLAAERRAIESERPIYNVHHNAPDAVRLAYVPPRRRRARIETARIAAELRAAFPQARDVDIALTIGISPVTLRTAVRMNRASDRPQSTIVHAEAASGLSDQ